MSARWVIVFLAGAVVAADAAEVPDRAALKAAFCAPLECPDTNFGGCSSLRCALLDEERVSAANSDAKARAQAQYTAECIPEECPIAGDDPAVQAAVADWKRLKATPLGCNVPFDSESLLLPGELRETAADTLGVVSCAVTTLHRPIRERAADRNQWRCAALKRTPPADCGGRCGAPTVLLDTMGVAKRRWCPSTDGGWGLCATRTTAVAAQLQATGVDEFGVVCPPPDDVAANCAKRFIPRVPSTAGEALLGDAEPRLLTIGILPEVQQETGVLAPLQLVEDDGGVPVVSRALITWSTAKDEAAASFVALATTAGTQGMVLVREVYPAGGGEATAALLSGWDTADLAQADECSPQPEAIARGELVAWQQELVIADPTARPWAEIPAVIRVGAFLRRCYHRAAGDVCVEVQTPVVVPPPPEPRVFAFAPAFVTSLDLDASPAESRSAIAAYLQARTTSIKGLRVGVLMTDTVDERAVLATADGVVRVEWDRQGVSLNALGPTVEASLAPLSDPARYAGRTSDADARVALEAALAVREGVVLTAPSGARACYLVAGVPRCRDGSQEAAVPMATPSAANGLDAFAAAYAERTARAATPVWTLAQALVTRANEPAMAGYRLAGVVWDANQPVAVFSEAPPTGSCWGNMRVVPLHDLALAPGPIVRWGVADDEPRCRADAAAALEGAFVEGAWLRALAELRDPMAAAHIVLPKNAKGEFLIARAFQTSNARLTVARPEAAPRALSDVVVASGHREPVSTEAQLHDLMRCVVSHRDDCTTQKKSPLAYFPRSRP